MKLKTKLVPLTSFALLGTTVVPLTLTSCGTNTATGVSHNLVKFYFPTIERLEPQVMSESRANALYLEQVLKNNDTFTQDYLWSKSQNGASFDQYSFWRTLLPSYDPSEQHEYDYRYGSAQDLFEYDNEVISDLHVTTQPNQTELIGMDELTLSFTLKFNGGILSNILNKEYLQGDTTGYVNGYVNGEINFNHVPFIVKSRTVEYYGTDAPIDITSVEPDADGMLNKLVEPWSINFYIASSISGQIRYNTGVDVRIANDFIFNKKANPDNMFWSEYGFGFDAITNMFSSSYYLERIRLI